MVPLLVPRFLRIPSLAAATLLAGSAASAQTAAGPSADSSVFIQYGKGIGSSKAYGIGATRDWPGAYGLGSFSVSGYWQAGAEWWKFDPASDGSSSRTKLGKFELTPVFRLRGDNGRSPWFVDAGIGLTYTTHLYRTEDKAASTRFNFGDQVAAGYLFGPNQAHELALRFEHMSNAGIKQPNPAINFYQLRYSYHFGD